MYDVSRVGIAYWAMGLSGGAVDFVAVRVREREEGKWIAVVGGTV